jgi:hypothetical protein
MNKVEITIDLATGKTSKNEMPFTVQEIAEAQAKDAEWLAAQPTQEEQIAKLQAQIDAIKGVK